MDLSILIFLTSGLFLGWALGANDAANVFGTAVGSRMVRFSTAAIICSICVILGAVISGAGATETLGKLGAINTLPASFMAAFAAAAAVYGMTKTGLPVSTSQAIVGAIIGWNLFSGTPTDSKSLTKILSTWVLCPILAAGFSMLIYTVVVRVIRHAKVHLLRTDAYTRLGLILAGAFGSYSLGANNIANVETPNYKRRDLPATFEKELNEAVSRGDKVRLNDLPLRTEIDKRTKPVGLDGNNVELDKELLEINRNALNYAFLSQYVGGSIQTINKAIRGHA